MGACDIEMLLMGLGDYMVLRCPGQVWAVHAPTNLAKMIPLEKLLLGGSRKIAQRDYWCCSLRSAAPYSGHNRLELGVSGYWCQGISVV